MGNIGSGEILLVLLVALLVLGPTRLPGAARQVGRAMSEFRRVTSGLQTEMRDAITEFEREVAVDEGPPEFSPPNPPTPVPAATPSADAPQAASPLAAEAFSAPQVPSTPAPATPASVPPPAESTWVFPDLTPEPSVSSQGEPIPEAARPESES